MQRAATAPPPKTGRTSAADAAVRSRRGNGTASCGNGSSVERVIKACSMSVPRTLGSSTVDGFHSIKQFFGRSSCNGFTAVSIKNRKEPGVW